MTLSATDVTLNVGGKRVLTDVSLTVEPGEVFTVVGPSGTGKTTILRLLAAFQRPDSGSISWNDADIWSLAEADRLAVRRRMSMVFQEPSLFNAPVHRNVTYGTRIRESWQDRIVRLARELVGDNALPVAARDALETVDLVEKVDQNALSLSGGEAQRVAFARALAVDPDVVLFDEPTSNLDPRNTAKLENAIVRARERGVGVVVATHDMHQAERISDRVGFLLEGELVETGPPESFFVDPKDPRTKQFIDGELIYDESAEADGRAAEQATGGMEHADAR